MGWKKIRVDWPRYGSPRAGASLPWTPEGYYRAAALSTQFLPAKT
jgi:hypothetical protein